MTPETKFANKVCKAFEKAGWTTINMESLGDGIPDRLIAKDGKAFLLESKIGANPLTKHQIIWLKKYYKNNLPYFKLAKHKEGIALLKISVSEGTKKTISGRHIMTTFFKKISNLIDIIAMEVGIYQ